MLSIPTVRRAVHYLHRPFVQRLITLVVSTLLALSLIALTSVPALPPSARQVASSASSPFAQSASARHLEAAHIKGLLPKTSVSGQGHEQATKQDSTERRFV
jgi:hypothetical protein